MSVAAVSMIMQIAPSWFQSLGTGTILPNILFPVVKDRVLADGLGLFDSRGANLSAVDCK